ncbi:MAG: sugar phosphate isomerase/epimerase family protein [Chthoniobacteraceae bacterium]
MVPLCFSTLGCPQDNVATLCERARRFGISTVEIRSLEGHVDYPGFLAEHPEALAHARERLQRARLAVAALGASFDLLGSSLADIPHLVETCRVADALGSPYVRIFGGGVERQVMTPKDLCYAADLYRQADAARADSGAECQLLVETHGALVDTATLSDFIAHAGQGILFLWDTHHTWRLGGDALAKTFALIGRNVRHLHCRDSISTGGEGYRLVFPGEGEFPYGDLLELLCSPEGKGLTLSLEWEKQWHPELPPLDEALERFLGIVNAREHS